jgi:hypothetical protein
MNQFVSANSGILIAVSDLNAPKPFDYSLLAPTMAETARSSADRIRSFHRDAIIESGSKLLLMKEALDHGQFTAWVESELNFSTSTARNYMAAAKAFGMETKTVAVLPPPAL